MQVKRDRWAPANDTGRAPANDTAGAPAHGPARAIGEGPASGVLRASGHRAAIRQELRPGDDAGIRRLFRATVCMGRPLPFSVPGWDAYESLCLDWYLGPGRADAAVFVDDRDITGYALVCTDSDGYHRWQRHQATLFTAHAVGRLMTRRPDSDGSRFLRLRLRDGWEMWRHGMTPPFRAHAHTNMAVAARGRLAGLQVTEHVDQRCRIAGLPGWFGEINATAGRRGEALQRLGLPVVHRAPNHTLSWLLGQPVERLTVARRLTAVGSDGPSARTAIVA